MTAPDIITSVYFPPAFQKAGGFKVVWSPPYSDESGDYPAATSYEVGVSQDDPTIDPITVLAPATSIIITGLLPSTYYQVWVRPLNGTDAGEWTHSNWTTNADSNGPRPRYAEFIRLKTITEKWVEWENVDGNETDPQIVNGGGPYG